MAIVLQVPAKDKKVFKSVIEELITEGKVHADLKGKIKPLADNVCTGTFMATQKGFGFVRVEGMEDDIFISAHKTKGALDGDKVQIILDTHSFKEQIPLESLCGSIGMTRSTRYTLVPLFNASLSKADFSVTYWLTSAICTPR